ncbi:hypothetical protein SEA_LUCHADOR_51 [Mycobacterium phage Luchador]|uniref:Uncharacterized protein n=1 Tax=Mycobacterium phage Luchador TaxID=1647300 RepID=A0A0F6WDS3_9CAUD|nr:hypothetical protein AVT52_gp53 [Mycobacterium phage Luchador]AKF14215.1 hypothetical protein SEA_LUCHADOR_51 [Mycobacterium phage Luchador]
MADRFEAIVIEPRDPALPLDVQGVALRRKAIEAMQALGSVDENSVRYKDGTDIATVSIGPKETLSLWQRNLFAALFYADGDAVKERDSVTVAEEDRRRFTSVRVNRDPYAA